MEHRFNYREIISSILSGTNNTLYFIVVYKYEALSNGEFEQTSITPVFAGGTIDECRQYMHELVSSCEPDEDEKYNFLACQTSVDTNEFDEFDAECDDAEEFVVRYIHETMDHDCNWSELDEGEWCDQTVTFKYESLADSIILYWKWCPYAGYARKPIRLEYCIDSEMTTQNCLPADSTDIQLTCLASAKEIKECSSATELSELIQKRFDSMGKWPKRLDAESFIKGLYEDCKRFGSLYTLPQNDLYKITNLEELAEYINSCEDYPVKDVMKTIAANGWEDTSAGSDYDICSDGTDKLVLDENTAEAKVVPLPTIKNIVGDKISELRTAKGFTQQQLADAAGTSRFSIIRLEAGAYNVSIEILDKILRALDAELTITKKETH